MGLLNKEIQTLNELGLTILQAKAYLALTRLGSAKVKTISKFSNVARSDLYRTLMSLQELGLVEKIVTAPLQFRATPLDQGLSLLLKKRAAEQKKLKLKTLRLIRAFRNSGKAASEAKDAKFVLVPSGNLFLDRTKAAINHSQTSVDLLLSWRRFSLGITDAFAENLENAWSRNVKFRFIVETSEEVANRRITLLCRENPNCQFRFITESPEYVFSIYDRKEAFIIVDPKANLTDSPALWTNNQSLISLLCDYFEILWFTSSEKHYFKTSNHKPNFENINKREPQVIS